MYLTDVFGARFSPRVCASVAEEDVVLNPAILAGLPEVLGIDTEKLDFLLTNLMM